MSKKGKHNQPLKELAITPVEKVSVREARFAFTDETKKLLVEASDNTAVAIAHASIEAYGRIFSSRSFIEQVRKVGFRGDSAILSKTFSFVKKVEGRVTVDRVVEEIDKFRADKVKKAASKTEREKQLIKLFALMKKHNDIETLVAVFEMLLDGGKVVPPESTEKEEK